MWVYVFAAPLVIVVFWAFYELVYSISRHIIYNKQYKLMQQVSWLRKLGLEDAAEIVMGWS